MRTKQYPLSILTEMEDDIIFIEYCRDLEIDLLKAKNIVAERIDFMKDRKHYLIIDATNIKSISSEAKTYLLNPDFGIKNILGSAMIASNPVSAMLANIFIKSSKHFQSKFFSKKTDAVEWIKELKRQ